MGRTIDQVIDALPKARRERVFARHRALKSEEENLRKQRRKHKKRTAGARNANDIIKRLGRIQRKKVEARAAELIAEEVTRRARKLTP